MHRTIDTASAAPSSRFNSSPRLPPQNPYCYPAPQAPQYPAYGLHEPWAQYVSPHVIDWRSAGPIDFGPDPIHTTRTRYLYSTSLPQVAYSQTVRPADLQAEAGPSTTVWPSEPAAPQRKSRSRKQKENDLDDPYLASIPVRRSARLQGRSPDHVMTQRVSIALRRSYTIFSHWTRRRQRPPIPSSSAEARIEKAKRWSCFYRGCKGIFKDSRARARHMDRHFPPRYSCLGLQCSYTHTREDQIKAHVKNCQQKGAKAGVIDDVPYWLQRPAKDKLRRPSESDSIWSEAPEWYHELRE